MHNTRAKEMHEHLPQPFLSLESYRSCI